MTTRQRLTAAGLLLVIFGLLAATSSALHPLPCATPAPDWWEGSTEEWKFWSLINDYRERRGLGGLDYDPHLADEAAKNNRAGGHHSYVPNGVAQNWCMNGSGMSAKVAFDMWKHSPGHNANMLGRGHVRCGIAFDGKQATLNLAR